MAGFYQALDYLNGHRDEEATIRLPYWKKGMGIRLRKIQDNDSNRIAEQPTQDYLTVGPRFGDIAWFPTQDDLRSNDWQLCDASCTVVAE